MMQALGQHIASAFTLLAALKCLSKLQEIDENINAISKEPRKQTHSSEIQEANSNAIRSSEDVGNRQEQEDSAKLANSTDTSVNEQPTSYENDEHGGEVCQLPNATEYGANLKEPNANPLDDKSACGQHGKQCYAPGTLQEINSTPDVTCSGQETKLVSKREHRENSDLPCIHVALAQNDELVKLYQELAFELAIFNNECTEVPLEHKTITVNGKEYQCQGETDLAIETNNDDFIDVNLKVSSFKLLIFKNCKKVKFLELSHTFIRHIDIRQLTDLEELRLMNTNIKRLNLKNQTKLRILFCNYTLLDYLILCNDSLSVELHIEYAGRLRWNKMDSNNRVFFDENQTTKKCYFANWVESRVDFYVVTYPEVGVDNKRIEIKFPKKCDEFVDRDIKECRELAVKSVHNDRASAINSLCIAAYPKLEQLSIEHVDCEQLSIVMLPVLVSLSISHSYLNIIELANLPLLTAIKLSALVVDNIAITNFPKLEQFTLEAVTCESFCLDNLPALIMLSITLLKIARVSIIGFPNLRHLIIARCYDSEQVHFEKCENLETLDVQKTRIGEIDVGYLNELQKLCVHGTIIEQLDVSKNIGLKVLDVSDTKVSYLEVGLLTELEILEATNTRITELNVFTNVKLEYLDIGSTKISELDVSELKELKELRIYNTKVRFLDVSYNISLEELDVNATYLSELDVSELTKLKKLWIHRTNIIQIDLSNNKELTEITASNNCNVSTCCCEVIVEDSVSFLEDISITGSFPPSPFSSAEFFSSEQSSTSESSIL